MKTKDLSIIWNIAKTIKTADCVIIVFGFIYGWKIRQKNAKRIEIRQVQKLKLRRTKE